MFRQNTLPSCAFATQRVALCREIVLLLKGLPDRLADGQQALPKALGVGKNLGSPL